MTSPSSHNPHGKDRALNPAPKLGFPYHMLSSPPISMSTYHGAAISHTLSVVAVSRGDVRSHLTLSTQRFAKAKGLGQGQCLLLDTKHPGMTGQVAISVIT